MKNIQMTNNIIFPLYQTNVNTKLFHIFEQSTKIVQRSNYDIPFDPHEK